jgi:hypothetical protein
MGASDTEQTVVGCLLAGLTEYYQLEVSVAWIAVSSFLVITFQLPACCSTVFCLVVIQIVNVLQRQLRVSEAEVENLPLPTLSDVSDILQESHLRVVGIRFQRMLRYSVHGTDIILSPRFFGCHGALQISFYVLHLHLS